MKKILLFALGAILLGACADDVLMQDSDVIGVNQVTFSFDSITDPVIWRTFKTFGDKMEACQIPENILKELSTDTLVALCMNHPMANNYIFYENPIKGAKIVMERFNGFQELKRRADAAEKILDYYEKMTIEDVAERKVNKYSKYRTEITPFKLGFVELAIASNEVPDLYSVENVGRLEKLSNAKYEQKLKCRTYQTSMSLSKSLMLGAKVKMAKSGVSTDEDSKQLKQFVENGGVIKETGELKEISKIIYSK